MTESIGPIHPYFLRRFVAFWILFSIHWAAAITFCVRISSDPSKTVPKDPILWGLIAFLVANIVPLYYLHLPAMTYGKLRRMRREHITGTAEDQTP